MTTDTGQKQARRCPTCGMPSLADELDKLRAELDEIKGVLRNFEANGSDAVKQIQGIYADLEIATNDMRAARTREKKLAPAIAAAVKQLDRTVGLDLPTPVTEAANILREVLANLPAAETLEHSVLDTKIEKQSRALRRAKHALLSISKWREGCHEHDADMGHEPRGFIDDEDWQLVEDYANTEVTAIYELLR